jgi:hypothetical protein
LQIPDIDSLPTLKKRLGKARTARIRYAQKGTGRRQPCATNIENTVIKEMNKYATRNGPVEDVLYGFAMAHDDSRPIGVSSLIAILECMPIINTREIQRMLDVSDRQAMKYLRVIRSSLPHIERTFAKQKANTPKNVHQLY